MADVTAEAFRARGFEVVRAAIQFTDLRYAKLFSRFPLRHAYLDVFRMILPQLRRATGEIRVPDVAMHGEYDLLCIGSPTICPTVLRGLSEEYGSWNTIWMSVR